MEKSHTTSMFDGMVGGQFYKINDFKILINEQYVYRQSKRIIIIRRKQQTKCSSRPWSYERRKRFVVSAYRGASQCAHV